MEYYKSIKLRINCNKTDYKRLQECNRESALIWNECIKKNTQLFQDEKKLLSKNELQKFVQDIETHTICAFNKQIVSAKTHEAYRATSKARKAGRTDIRYPYKNKNFYETEWNYNFLKINDKKNQILLTTARFVDSEGKKRNGKPIRLSFKTKLPQNIKILKLVFEHGCFYACINYTIELKEQKEQLGGSSAIDLGEIHAISAITNNANQLIITGRKIRSIKQFRNKKQAELKRKQSKCKKGSRQWNKYRLAYAKIKSKARRQLDYHIHKLTRLYVNWAMEKGISVVYCGDVTGIEVRSNKGTNVNQKLNQWEYGLIMWQLDYKLIREGIAFKKVPEYYTSQICPSCGFKHKPKNRNYDCPNCLESYHRDIVGAYNILKMNTTGFDVKLPHNNIKYLRIV